jgi:hypothetical protein
MNGTKSAAPIGTPDWGVQRLGHNRFGSPKLLATAAPFVEERSTRERFSVEPALLVGGKSTSPAPPRGMVAPSRGPTLAACRVTISARFQSGGLISRSQLRVVGRRLAVRTTFQKALARIPLRKAESTWVRAAPSLLPKPQGFGWLPRPRSPTLTAGSLPSAPSISPTKPLVRLGRKPRGNELLKCPVIHEPNADLFVFVHAFHEEGFE